MSTKTYSIPPMKKSGHISEDSKKTMMTLVILLFHICFASVSSGKPFDYKMY